jgi:hypothetical protein
MLDPAANAWRSIPALPPFQLANGKGPAIQQTTARLCYDEAMLYLHYDCQDRDIWAISTQRDDPIYDEEVVELFIGAGEADLVDYFEFEINPWGVILDVKVHNPTSERKDMLLDFPWDAPLACQTQCDEAANRWQVWLGVPWSALGVEGILPKVWRGNLYRIERPRDSEPEFSCWSPTMTEPADFHKPAYFGILELA